MDGKRKVKWRERERKREEKRREGAVCICEFVKYLRDKEREKCYWVKGTER